VETIDKRCRIFSGYIMACSNLIPLISTERNSSCEADSSSASQEIPRSLWNPKFHNRIHNSPPHVPILNQIYSVHTFPFHFNEDPFNIILSSTPMFSKWSLYLRSCHQNAVDTFPISHSYYMLRSFHSSCSYHPNNIW
jgi:hypothetical protein